MLRRLLILTLLIGAWSARESAAQRPPKAGAPLVLAHYMPWFESKEISGKWGWHWTMGRLNPDVIDAQDKRQIAAHVYPLIGPYDSADPDVLEYHTLLMKLSGIDGVIADWYAAEDRNDYAMIHQRTQALFKMCKRRGLQFAVCYEERIVKSKGATLEMPVTKQQIAEAHRHLEYCCDEWFKDPLYVKWQKQPILVSYGPETFQPSDWSGILPGLKPKPALFLLHKLQPPAAGSFVWPPMWASTQGVLEGTVLKDYLNRFYAEDGIQMGGVFPGFHDFYQEAGVSPSHGFLDARDGEVFRETLQRALASDCPFIQVITWNDFGEGTTVEPAREYEYKYLEQLQKARASQPSKRRYRAQDLRLPLRVFNLRKSKLPADSAESESLDRAVDLLFAGEAGRAAKILDNLER